MLENMQDISLQSSHEVGVDALWLEFLNGFVLFIKSIYECQKKGKDHKEALKHTAIATLKGGALSYGSAFASSSLGGLMQSSTNRIIQSFGNSSVPTMIGGVGAAPVIAILGALSAAKMEKKLEDAKAYCSQVEAAVKKADVAIDNLQAVRKMADLFTRQITKFDVLFFSLSQEAIATMRKHNYDTSRYNQKEKDQLSVTVSTLMTLSAFLKAPIMDERQKLTEKAKNALILMRDQTDSLENGNYSLDGIRFRQARLEDLRDDKTS
ncbi:sortase [Helicobacter pylori]|uniref:sortase n=1 Tax=Helicobacter pylori TaxID=210 RepID=UPI00041973C3|nr:sortase [Helicobacter pylori]